LSFFYLDDFVADVGKRARNCASKSAENLVDFHENWVDVFDQHIDMETVVLLLRTRLIPRKME